MHKTETKTSLAHRKPDLLWAALGTALTYGHLAYVKGRPRADFAS